MIPIPIARQKQFLLHTRALECAAKYRKLEGELLDLIQQIDAQKLFRDLGYSSLFTYIVSALKLSESQAFNFINVARKANEVPELKTQILKGKISVSKARKIVPVLTKANQAEWIPKAIALPQKEIERQVADAQPGLRIPERIRPKGKGRTELRCGLSVELEGKLKRAQDLLAKKRRRAVTLEETLEETIGFYLVKNDPVAKEHRQTVARQLRTQKLSSRQPSIPTPRPVPVTKSRHIPAAVRRTVHARDEGRCRHREPDGKRCAAKRWVELHHLRAFSLGGSHEAHNLV
ncbi:MAG: hypothetical protein KDD51_12950, partial [Bdellovibrionales bacterium]|nr:hypothetical protein [Bdellovibrionales bacterium]